MKFQGEKLTAEFTITIFLPIFRLFCCFDRVSVENCTTPINWSKTYAKLWTFTGWKLVKATFIENFWDFVTFWSRPNNFLIIFNYDPHKRDFWNFRAILGVIVIWNFKERNSQPILVIIMALIFCLTDTSVSGFFDMWYFDQGRIAFWLFSTTTRIKMTFKVYFRTFKAILGIIAMWHFNERNSQPSLVNVMDLIFCLTNTPSLG